MRKFIFAAVVAAACGLGFTSKAEAQYMYGYNTINPYTGSVITNRGVYTPLGSQMMYGYYNPYTGAAGQRYMYTNPWGTSVYRSNGYNPTFGTGYSSGYYYPGFGVSPYAGNYYRYRW
jgi:hypothetical protein